MNLSDSPFISIPTGVDLTNKTNIPLMTFLTIHDQDQGKCLVGLGYLTDEMRKTIGSCLTELIAGSLFKGMPHWEWCL
jgi:hypothetical protein